MIYLFRVLPTPLQASEAPVLRNSYGAQISLSFLPITSVVLSFLMVLMNASLNYSSSQKEKPINAVWRSWLVEFGSWFTYMFCTVLFRIHAWVLLFSFLAEFAIGVALLVVVSNIIIIIRRSDLSKIEPFICGLYSAMVPTVQFLSTSQGTKKDHKTNMNKVLRQLTVLGNMMLLAALLLMFFVVREHWLDYSLTIRIRRESILPNVIAAVVAGGSSLLAVVVLPRKGLTEEDLRQKMPKQVARVTLLAILTSGTIAAYGYMLVHRNGEEQFIRFAFNSQPCNPIPGWHGGVNLTAYLRNDIWDGQKIFEYHKSIDYDTEGTEFCVRFKSFIPYSIYRASFRHILLGKPELLPRL